MVDDEPMRPSYKDMSTLYSGQCTSSRDAGTVSQVRIFQLSLRQARQQLDTNFQHFTYLHFTAGFSFEPGFDLAPPDTFTVPKQRMLCSLGGTHQLEQDRDRMARVASTFIRRYSFPFVQ